jgi:hypothetical protein
MRTCHYYILFEPVGDTLQDDPSVPCAVDLGVRVKGAEWRLCVIADDAGVAKYLRISMPGLVEDSIPLEHGQHLQGLIEHMITVLRISYAHELVAFPIPVWVFANDGEEWRINMKLQFRLTPARLNGPATQNLYASSYAMREELRLFADGADNRIPLQYRLLSLYRLLELLFRREDKWDNSGMQAAFEPHAGRLRELGIKRNIVKYVHEMRDRCAHIRVGRKGRFGVTHLKHAEAKRVNDLLPIMLDVCAAELNARAAGKFRVGRGRPRAV